MSAGWEMAEGGRGGRLRVHTLRAGVFWAKISEWADRGTACRLVLRIDYPDSSPGAYATAQTVASWCGDASDLEADKGRLEAEIRRLATEALAALPARPSPETEAGELETLAASCHERGLHDRARRLRERAAVLRSGSGGAS